MIIKFSNLSTTSNRRRTEEGFLDVPATIYRSGLYKFLPSEFPPDVLPPNLKNKEQITLCVPESAIRDPEFLSSARARPVTDGHPDRSVDAKTATKVSRGVSVGEPRVWSVPEGTAAGIDVRIFDEDLIRRIESREVEEVSIGNTGDAEFKGGDLDGIPFDGLLDKIRINHIAVVKTGRAGRTVRLDNAGADTMDPNETEIEPGTTETASPELGEKIAELSAKIDALVEMVSTLVPTVENADPEAKPEDEAGKNADPEVKPEDEAGKNADPEKDPAKVETNNAAALDKLVDQRIEIQNAAKRLAPKIDVKKSNREIMVSTINVVNSSLIKKGDSDEVVSAVFRTLSEIRTPESVSAGVALLNTEKSKPGDARENARAERVKRDEAEFRRVNKL